MDSTEASKGTGSKFASAGGGGSPGRTIAGIVLAALLLAATWGLA